MHIAYARAEADTRLQNLILATAGRNLNEKMRAYAASLTSAECEGNLCSVLLIRSLKLVARCRGALTSKDFRSSLQLLRKARKDDPRSVTVSVELAYRDVLLGRITSAYLILAEVEPLSKDYARFHSIHGNVLAERGDVVGARSAFRLAQEACPTFHCGWFGDALLEHRLRRYQAAEAKLQHLLYLFPGNAQALLGLALLPSDVLPDWKALRLLSYIAELDRTVPVLELLIAIHIRSGAEAYLEDSIAELADVEPDNPRLLFYRRCFLALRDGDVRRARSSLKPLEDLAARWHLHG